MDRRPSLNCHRGLTQELLRHVEQRQSAPTTPSTSVAARGHRGQRSSSRSVVQAAQAVRTSTRSIRELTCTLQSRPSTDCLTQLAIDYLRWRDHTSSRETTKLDQFNSPATRAGRSSTIGQRASIDFARSSHRQRQSRRSERRRNQRDQASESESTAKSARANESANAASNMTNSSNF